MPKLLHLMIPGYFEPPSIVTGKLSNFQVSMSGIFFNLAVITRFFPQKLPFQRIFRHYYVFQIWAWYPGFFSQKVSFQRISRYRYLEFEKSPEEETQIFSTSWCCNSENEKFPGFNTWKFLIFQVLLPWNCLEKTLLLWIFPRKQKYSLKYLTVATCRKNS